MAPEGFEPPTPRLRVWCSDQAELWSHDFIRNILFIILSIYLFPLSLIALAKALEIDEVS